MPQNLEIKVKLTSFNKVKAVLKKIGARKTATLKQKDIYYKNKTGLLKLRIENGKSSIIKYARTEKSSDRFSNYSVLHFEEDAVKFFDGILTVETVVDKTRELYMYKNTRIHLDKIKGLGNFLELETLVLYGKADARKKFSELLQLLEIETSQELRCSNRDLMLKKKKTKK